MTGRLRSLRVQALSVVSAVVLLPLLFAWLAGIFGAGAAPRMQQASRRSAELIAQRLQTARLPLDAQLWSELDGLAAQHRVRLRILTRDGQLRYEIDHDARRSLWDRLGGLFFGPGGPPTIRGYEAQQSPDQKQLQLETAWRANGSSGCDVPVGEKTPLRLMLICHTALRVDRAAAEFPLLVIAQKSERRTFRAIHDLRYQLLKLTLLVLLMAGLLGWWLGWRMVRPIEALRDQVLLRTAGPPSTLPITLRRRDEFADLARAFNDLLHTLEKRNRSNEAFIADLVHEMKNPVAAIRACAERMEGGEALDEARKHRMSRVLRDSSRRLETLVTWFLDLARAEAGLLNEERARIDIHALLAALIESMRSGDRYGQVRFKLSGASGPSAELHGVSGRLESALQNLLDNAASFAGPGGDVSVSIDGFAEQIIVTIKDSGPGIAPSDLPRVFERFFTTRASQQGTGLGLPLSRAIVEAHGGTITVSSALGHGATFTVRLPRSHEPPAHTH